MARKNGYDNTTTWLGYHHIKHSARMLYRAVLEHRINPMLGLAAAPLAIAAAVASAQTAAAQCQFSAGLGDNSACASGPQDDYSDVIWPNTFGYAPGLWPGSFFPDNALPGISGGHGR